MHGHVSCPGALGARETLDVTRGRLRTYAKQIAVLGCLQRLCCTTEQHNSAEEGRR